MQYSVTTRAGKTHTVDSDLTDAQAQETLAGKAKKSDFDNVLIDADRLSPKMRAWLHVLAQWTLNPRENEGEGSFPGILSMLQGARDAGKKFPKIKLDTDHGLVVLALNRAGKVNVTDGKPFGENVWYGAIQDDATWRAPRGGNLRGKATAIFSLLSELESDPARVASQHGVATGNCCFCAHDLTTKESRSVGYGPICAGKFGLPWGAIDPDLDKAGKEELSI